MRCQAILGLNFHKCHELCYLLSVATKPDDKIFSMCKIFYSRRMYLHYQRVKLSSAMTMSYSGGWQ